MREKRASTNFQTAVLQQTHFVSYLLFRDLYLRVYLSKRRFRDLCIFKIANAVIIVDCISVDYTGFMLNPYTKVDYRCNLITLLVKYLRRVNVVSVPGC